MLSKRKYYVVFFALFAILCAAGSFYGYSKWSKPDTMSKQYEFIMTSEETAAISKWRDRSMNDLIDDAYSGDPAGLWLIGNLHLRGTFPFPLNLELANKHFALSASLGFAPAMDELRKMHSDLNNSYLALVYLNLTIAYGHQELLGLYYKGRSILASDDDRRRVVAEIENIAFHKQKMIEKNVSKTMESSGYFADILSKQDSFIEDDILFDQRFWRDISKGYLKTGNLSDWIISAKNNRSNSIGNWLTSLSSSIKRSYMNLFARNK